MGRSPCCDEVGLKKGPWTPEEDKVLIEYIEKNGHGSWRRLPKLAGLNRCGKSCRLRWTNYLRPDIKRGRFDEEEERLIIHLHSVLGNKWSAIAMNLPGRTDNEIKNYWNTHIRKKLLQMGIDPVTHQPRTDLNVLAGLPSLLAAAANLGNLTSSWDSALRLQADAAQLAKFQLLQGLMQVMASSSSPPPLPNMDALSLLRSASLHQNYQLQEEVLLKLNQLQPSSADHSHLMISGSLGVLTPHDSIPMPSSFSSFGGFPQMPKLVPSDQTCSSSDQFLMDKNGGHAASDHIRFNNPNASADPAPSLVSASPEDHHRFFDKMHEEPITSSEDDSGSSPTTSSAPFEAWKRLNLDDLDNDLCWKDILDQVSWSHSSS